MERTGRRIRNQDAGRHQAFRLEVTSIQCKLKLNQHRPEAHAAMREAYRQGTPAEQALGRWMDRLEMS